MFPCLRHHALVRGDNEHYHINPACACEHILYEPLVPGDINKAKMHAARFEFGETEVDRYAAFLFLGQAVGVGPGQRAYERSFAVVDMPSRADDYIHSSIWIIARRGKGTR